MTEPDSKKDTFNDAFGKRWHYRPNVPIQVSPFFSWPFNPARMFEWIAARWFRITENTLLIVIASISWFWLQPPLQETKSLEFGWIAQMYLRNLILLLVVAGGLHLYFYVYKRQGKTLKYDSRDLSHSSKIFTFNGQVRDNMFWSLGSGVFFWTAYEALMIWAMSNGFAPVLNPLEHPIWFVALFFLTPVIISIHFYWIHRLLHWPPLYKAAHALHHRNTNVGPWSGLSMHPLEHLLFFSSVLVHLIIAAHPLHILFHLQHQALTAATSHTGFESLRVGDRDRLALGTFHHQMHHRYCDCNYGNLEWPWDKWFGSFHNGTAESHKQFEVRRRRLNANADRA